MTTKAATPPIELADLAAECIRDPLRFVLYAYPWGEPGTLLEHEDGPDTWQADLLEDMREHLQAEKGTLRIAAVSGHGVGKSTLIAWLIQWFVATRANPQVIVTANTANQLETKTWRELSKWHQLSAFRSLFTWSATRYALTVKPETWAAHAIPWRKEKAEAFAGAHDKNVAIIMDEASAIDDIIWDTAEGAMTSPGSLWVAFGNGTRNSGRFKELFPGGRFAHRWKPYHIDANTAKKADKQQIAQWIADYGADSDFVRSRVLGQFPRVGSMQFIGDGVLTMAKLRTPAGHEDESVVLGVDCARYGDDASVLITRKGGRILRKQVFRELPSDQLRGHIIATIRDEKADMCFIDSDGLGGPIADDVRAMGYRDKVFDVYNGKRATDVRSYHDKRAECWARMRAWLTDRGHIDPEWRQLLGELGGIEYGYDDLGRIQLESKDDMKRRGLSSPDEADALAYTFSEFVAPKQSRTVFGKRNGEGREGGRTWMG